MELNRIVEIAQFAKKNNGAGPLSTGEALTAALVLNRHDWLKRMDYTIAEALERIDTDTVQHLRDAERIVKGEA